MSQKDEYQRLASQFVDIWQKNMATVMNDSEFIRTFLQMVQNPSYGKPSATQATTGSAAASDAGNAAITGIKNRLTAIEERLHALERAFTRIMSSATRPVPESVDRFAKRHKPRKSGRSRSNKKNR